MRIQHHTHTYLHAGGGDDGHMQFTHTYAVTQNTHKSNQTHTCITHNLAYTYIYIYMHACGHTCIQAQQTSTVKHTPAVACAHTSGQAGVQAYTHTCVHCMAYTHAFTHTHIRAGIYTLICSDGPTWHPPNLAYTHTHNHANTHTFTHTYAYTQS